MMLSPLLLLFFNVLVASPMEPLPLRVSSLISTEDSVPAYQLKGLPVPYFTGVTLDGDTVSPATFKDKVVLLNFWFIGCPPCMKEVPCLNELTRHYENDDVIFLSIAQNTKEDLIKFQEARDLSIEELKMLSKDEKAKVRENPYGLVKGLFGSEALEIPVIPACPERKPGRQINHMGFDCELIAEDFFVNSYPTTFFIDREGIIREVKVGFQVLNITGEDEIRGTAPWREYTEEIDFLLMGP